MKTNFLLLLAASCLGLISFSQDNTSISINGTVKSHEKNEPLARASVRIKGGASGTMTDSTGHFHLAVSSLPVILEISFAEFENREIEVTNKNELIITLEPVSGILNPVTLVGTRILTRSMNVPVTHEYISRTDLINTPAESYWSSMLAKTGLDVTTSSFAYKTYSTRGFNLSGSSRVNQFMDGMDNQAPGLNFSVGNFLGLSEPDVENIEILPGASSALYGPGGLNGTILVNSKNPFKYPGLSIIAKQGVLGIGENQREKTGGFYDYSFRWAKTIGNRFAFKLGAQYIQAIDWLANDSINYLRMGSTGKTIAGNRQTDPNYDGVNVYGDETSLNVRAISTQAGTVDLWALVGAGIKQVVPQLTPGIDAVLALTPPALPISRTGYNEIDVIDPKTKNLKLSGALHYKFNNNLEGILSGHWGTGNTVYTGNNRYVFKGIKMGQYKLELKHKNWFLRGYTTQENAGEAYSATVTSQYFNEAWKPSGAWYQQYAQSYLVRAATLWLTTYATQGSAAANAAVLAGNMNFHSAGRSAADIGRPAPGSAQFKNLFDSVRKVPIPKGGLFLDKSQLWMTEGQYNFSDKIQFAEIIVGANIKKYILNSQGTIFIDTAGAINIKEWGSYAQITKKLFDDKLVLSASGRYDKNENFKAKFTPRATVLIKVAKNNNLRMSYQTAYRFPSTQQQWIKLDVGSAFLLGGLPWINNYLNIKSNPTFIFNNGQMTPYTYKELKPESLRSFEVGFKSLVNKKLLLDAYAYFGRYSDFLGRIIVVQPGAPKPYSVVTNSDTKVKTWGMGISVDYKMAGNYTLFFNTYTDNLTNVPGGFEAGFNTPQYRINAGFGNTGLGKKERVGFNINLRWQDAFYYEGGGFANGDVKAYTTLDAQVNYKLPEIKSMIKLGGTNITNKYYKTAFGNPSIGGMYYLSFAYNIL